MASGLWAPKTPPPSGVLEALQAVDRRLGLYCDVRLKRWAVTAEWTESDPRRSRVQSGELPSHKAFDIVCWLPLDCSPEQALGYVERFLRPLQGEASVKALLDRVEAERKKARGEALQPVRELAEELIEANAPKVRNRLPDHWAARRERRKLDHFLTDVGLK